MRNQKFVLAAGVPKVVPLDTNMVPFNVSILAVGSTVEVTLDNVQETAPGAVAWVASPAAGANGLIALRDVVAAVRITNAGAAVATLLQHGIR